MTVVWAQEVLGFRRFYLAAPFVLLGGVPKPAAGNIHIPSPVGNNAHKAHHVSTLSSVYLNTPSVKSSGYYGEG
jgi:hypothetical protein